MKKTTIIIVILLFGCTKQNIQQAKVLKKADVSVSLNQQVISDSNIVDGHVKSMKIVGNVTTYTYDVAGVTMSETKRSDGKYNIVGKLPGQPDDILIETRTVSGTLTTFSFADIKGIEIAAMTIDPTGHILTMRNKRSCLGDAIVHCLHSGVCMLACQTGGWAGCIYGWIAGCALNIL